MTGTNDVVKVVKKVDGAVDKAGDIVDTLKSGKKAYDTITDPNARTSDKLGDITATGTSIVNQYLPEPVEIPEEFNDSMREFYTGVEDAMDGKTTDGKDLNTYNKEKERKYGKENNTDNATTESGYTGFHKRDPYNSMKEKENSYPDSRVETDFSGKKDADIIEQMNKELEWANGKLPSDMTEAENKKYQEILDKYAKMQMERDANKDNNPLDSNQFDINTPSVENNSLSGGKNIKWLPQMKRFYSHSIFFANAHNDAVVKGFQAA